MAMSTPEFAGAAGDFPFYFLPYASQALGDGSLQSAYLSLEITPAIDHELRMEIHHLVQALADRIRKHDSRFAIQGLYWLSA